MSTSWPICDHVDKTTIRLFGQPVQVATGIIGAVKMVELEARRTTKYGRWLVDHKAPAEIQCGACRVIRGDGGAVTIHNHSEHSHWHTFDIRPWENPMSDAGVPRMDFDRFGDRDGIRFVNIWKKAGWRWGGDWSRSRRHTRFVFAHEGHDISTGRVDTMHFEYELSRKAAKRRGSLRRLRLYRARHPIFMGKLLKAEHAKSCKQLYRMFREGSA
jgi:hypothetical protein